MTSLKNSGDLSCSKVFHLYWGHKIGEKWQKPDGGDNFKTHHILLHACISTYICKQQFFLYTCIYMIYLHICLLYSDIKRGKKCAHYFMGIILCRVGCQINICICIYICWFYIFVSDISQKLCICIYIGIWGYYISCICSNIISESGT